MITAVEAFEHADQHLRQATTQWVRISDIKFDMRYQRTPGQKKIDSIAAHFNEFAAGTCAVNQREDGDLVGMDGQHRIKAMEKRGLTWVECKVGKGLTLQQEAEIFWFCNYNRKSPDARETFKARLIAKDSIAITINAIVERCGLSIQLQGKHGKHTPDAVQCVGALEEIFLHKKSREEGEKTLEYVLRLAGRCFPGTGEAFEAGVLLGIERFHVKYQGRYSREELIRKVNVEGFKNFRQKALYHMRAGNLHDRQAFCNALLEVYDYRKRDKLAGKED